MVHMTGTFDIASLCAYGIARLQPMQWTADIIDVMAFPAVEAASCNLKQWQLGVPENA